MPPKKSVVWDYFIKDKTTHRVKCNLCKQTFKDFGNTTNLTRHLKTSHPIQYCSNTGENNMEIDSENILEASTSTCDGIKTTALISSSVRKSVTQRKLQFSSNQNTNKINQALVNMICTDLQPLQIVENPGFKNFVTSLNPNYTLPCRKTLSETLLTDRYSVARAAFLEKMKHVPYVSITTDTWTSDSTKSFIAITCHYIYNSNLETVILSTIEIKKSHTAENLANILRKTLADKWKLMDKVTAIVTDNAANIKKAVTLLNIQQISCNAHTLNLIVQNSIEADNELCILIEKCRQIVGYFKRSSSGANTLAEIQEKMNLPKLKLKQDVTTRWNSTYFMHERLKFVRVPLAAALSALPAAPNNLSECQWDQIGNCIDILQPIQEMTRILSGEQYPTLSCIIPLIRGLHHALESIRPSTTLGMNLKRNIINNLNVRFDKVESTAMYAVSTLLDPRFKIAAFLDVAKANEAKDVLKNELCTIAPPEMQETVENVEPGNCDGKSSLWNFLDSKVSAHTKHVDSSAAGQLLHYLDLPYEPRNSNPLLFWLKRKDINADLYQISTKYFSIPATSVPSERVFSKAGLLCNRRRNLLGSKKIDMILFLNSCKQ